jgi:TPR repeat protein
MTPDHNFDLMQQVYEYIEEEDYESAYNLIKPEAENGDGDFEHILGVFYRDGKFIQQSYGLAVYWLTKSALKGDSNSQVLLGQIFAFDFGGLGNIDEGIRWLTESAASNNALACTYLGEVHAKGLKTGTPDYVSAAIAFTRGSELGSNESKQKLAYYYSNGLEMMLVFMITSKPVDVS